MRRYWWIGSLVCVVAACSLLALRRSVAPETLVARAVSADIAAFSSQLQYEFLPAARDQRRSLAGLRALFLRSRLSYKKFEWAAEYFTPAQVRLINGPPVPEVDAGEAPMAPGGLQVVEVLLYGGNGPVNRDRLVAQLQSMIRQAALAQMYFEQVPLLDWQVWDAERLEVFRVLTLGISGFDAPMARSGIAEAAAALAAMPTAIGCYPVNADSLNISVERCVAYLRANPDFDAFDRAQFITQYGNSLSKAVAKTALGLHLHALHYSGLLRQHAVTLFDSNAFDRQAYAADAKPGNGAMIALGQRLFHETSLSGNGSRSCASCHDPAKGFTDGLGKNRVIGSTLLLKRHTPGILYAAYQPGQFADMHASSLEEQVADVVGDRREMHSSLALAAKRLSKDASYARLFNAVYPDSVGVRPSAIAAVIAAYVRSLGKLDSRFDAYMRGNFAAMNGQEIKGFNLFMGKAKCGTCHYMPLFNGVLPPGYARMDAEVIGVPSASNPKALDGDSGRFALIPTASMLHAFKTPSLRDAALTAPYMHNGVFKNLNEVIDFYNKGGGQGLGLRVDNQTLAAEPLHLNKEEVNAVIAFIGALNHQ